MEFLLELLALASAVASIFMLNRDFLSKYDIVARASVAEETTRRTMAMFFGCCIFALKAELHYSDYFFSNFIIRLVWFPDFYRGTI